MPALIAAVLRHANSASTTSSGDTTPVWASSTIVSMVSPEPRPISLAAPAAEIMRISAYSTIPTALTLSGARLRGRVVLPASADVIRVALSRLQTANRASGIRVRREGEEGQELQRQRCAAEAGATAQRPRVPLPDRTRHTSPLSQQTTGHLQRNWKSAAEHRYREPPPCSLDAK